MKRVLMCVLVAVMVVGLASTAFAAAGDIAPKAFSDISGHEAEGELTLLAALGVYSGENGLGGAVKPDDPITRAQFCKVVVLALGRGTTANGLAGLKPSFKDEIPTWAWGYVNAAVYMGIIKGYEDGTFKPNSPVTYAEAITMLIRSVAGHVAQVGPGLWPYNYVFYGVDNGFAGPVDVGFANLPATRGDVARMLVATMKINKLNKDGEELTGTSILAGRILEGVVTDYAGDHSSITINSGSSSATVGLADKVYIVGAFDYEGLRNLNVLAIKRADGKVFFLQVGESANVVRGVFDKLLDTNSDSGHLKDTILLKDGTKVAFDEAHGVAVTLNRGTGYDQGDLTAGDELTITLGESGKAVNVAALSFDAGEDYVVDFDKSVASPKTDTRIELASHDVFSIPADCQVTINGVAASRDDLKVDDVVSIATKDLDGDTPIVIRATRQLVEGTVKSASTSYPGPVYRVTIEKKSGGTQTYVLNPTYLSMPTAGVAVKYGLNAAGQLFVPVGYESVTPYVVITGYTVDGAGHRTVTVDLRGQAVTYKCDGFDFHDKIGSYYRLGIDMADGSIDTATQLAVSGDYQVLAVDAAHGSMTLKNGSTVYFVDNEDLVVYKVTTSGKVYIGLGGLEAGDHVRADAAPSSAAVFELIP